MKVKKICLLFCFFFGMSVNAFILFASERINEKSKINRLIESIATSKASFYRNGNKYTAEKAASHMKFKYGRAKNMFVFFGPETKFTAREFIEKIASKSSTTGRPYWIERDGKKMKIGPWLLKKLEQMEGRDKK